MRPARRQGVHPGQRIVQFLATREADLIGPVFDREDAAQLAVVAVKQAMKDRAKDVRWLFDGLSHFFLLAYPRGGIQET